MNKDYNIENVGKLTEKTEILIAIDNISKFLQKRLDKEVKNDQSVISAFLARTACYLSLKNFENAFSDLQSAILSVSDYNEVLGEMFNKILPRLYDYSFETVLRFNRFLFIISKTIKIVVLLFLSLLLFFGFLSLEEDEFFQNSFIFRMLFESIKNRAMKDKDDEIKLKDFILSV